MQHWQQIREWRRTKRDELRAQRLSVPRAERLSASAACSHQILQSITHLNPACIGFYWPFKGEVVIRTVVDTLLAKGTEAALPVVVEKNQPLEFWAWDPATELRPGVWNIPVPAKRTLRNPDILLVPLLGFDEAGYRLGNGGGYYDRTLAQLTPRPRTIGVGYALGRLATIYPQSHDIPMDAIVTEDGFHWM